MVAVLVGAAILVSLSYMAMKMLSSLVVTPPTSVRELSDEPRRLMDLEGKKVNGLWLSPDGGNLAIMAFSEEESRRHLLVYRLEDPAAPLLDLPVSGYEASWSVRDGKPFLVYEDGGVLRAVDPYHLQTVQLTPGDAGFDSDPRISPDGSRLLFMRTLPEGQGRPQMLVMDLGTGEERYLGPWGGEPRWSPEGTRLVAFQSLGRFGERKPGECLVELIDAADGSRQLLSVSGKEILYMDWLDEGSLLMAAFYMTADLSESSGVIYRMDADPPGAEEKALGTLKSLDCMQTSYGFRLSRERKRLAYRGTSGLEFFDLEEERVYRERSVPGVDALDWRPGGKGLVFALGDIIYLLDIER